MIRRMARIGFFTLLFVSLTIIARAEMLPDILYGMDTRAVSSCYPITHTSVQMRMDARSAHLDALREIERGHMLYSQEQRVLKENEQYRHIVEYLGVIQAGVSSECEVFLVMGEPDEVIDSARIGGYALDASRTRAAAYIYTLGYARPEPGQKIIAKRFYFTAVGRRPATQMLDLLVTIDDRTGVVVDYAFYFKNGITQEFWEEAMPARIP